LRRDKTRSGGAKLALREEYMVGERLPFGDESLDRYFS